MRETPSNSPYAVFGLPAFRGYILGSLMVRIGVGVQGLAIGWELYKRTDEPLALGLAALVQAVPMLLLTLPAGWLADRYDRRRLIMISMAGTMTTSLGLAVLSLAGGSTEWMYALLLGDACALALARPARQALLPRLVPREMFEAVVKWTSSLGQTAAVLGPAIGGFIAAASLPAAYLFCAATQAAFIVVLAFVQLMPAPSPSEPVSWRSVLAGIRFIWDRPLLLSAISLDLFAVLLGGAVYLLPIFAKDILHVDEAGLGLLRAAPAVGALCMGLLLAHLPPMKRAGRNLLLAVAGFGVATIVFGFSRNFVLSLFMLALTGAFDNVSVVVRRVLVQLRTPDEMRGRVSAVNMVFIGSSNELGGFESGTVAHFLGPVVSVVSGGIGTLLVVLTTARLCPQLRRFGVLSSAGDTVEDATSSGNGSD